MKYFHVIEQVLCNIHVKDECEIWQIHATDKTNTSAYYERLTEGYFFPLSGHPNRSGRQQFKMDLL